MMRTNTFIFSAFSPLVYLFLTPSLQSKVFFRKHIGHVGIIGSIRVLEKLTVMKSLVFLLFSQENK